jgi:hypothetical protein
MLKGPRVWWLFVPLLWLQYNAIPDIFYKYNRLPNVIVKKNPSQNFIVKSSLAEDGKAICVTSHQPRWQKVLPANPDSGKSTALTYDTITIIAGSKTRDFPPNGMVEGYFPPHRMAGRYVSLSPSSVKPVLTITFRESYFY